SFVFSTGLAPVSAAAATRALGLLVESPELVATVAKRAGELRTGIARAGAAPVGFGHVVPVVVGPPERAVRLASRLREEGIVAPAIRPPTVPDGAARIRFTVTAAHSEADVARAVAAFGAAFSRL